MLLVRNQASGRLDGIVDDLATLATQGPAILAKAVTIIKKVAPYIDTAVLVVNDPALPKIMQRINTLHDIEAKKVQAFAVIAHKPPPTKDKIGISLKSFILPLDAFIYIKKNPIVPWLVGLGVLLLIGGTGYRLGQRRALR